MDVRVWADGAVVCYEGSRDNIPDACREDVALLDASDTGIVEGVGAMFVSAFGVQVYCLSKNMWKNSFSK